MTVNVGLAGWARSCALAQAGRAADRVSLWLHQAGDAAQRGADRALKRPGPDVADEHHAQALRAVGPPYSWLGEQRVEDYIDREARRLIRDAGQLTHLEPLRGDDLHHELWSMATLVWPQEHQARMQLHPSGQQNLARHVGAMQSRMDALGLELVRRTG